MRLFIAISFSDREKTYLKGVQDVVKQSAVKGNFTYYDNLHVTLKYLGETPESMIDTIVDIMDDIGENHRSFRLKFGPIGAFSRYGKQLVWVGFSEGLQAMKNIFKDLENGLEPLGYTREKRRFNPHVTIAREVVYNNATNPSLPLPLLKLPIKITGITLMQSHRVHGRLTYTPIHTSHLEG